MQCSQWCSYPTVNSSVSARYCNKLLHWDISVAGAIVASEQINGEPLRKAVSCISISLGLKLSMVVASLMLLGRRFHFTMVLGRREYLKQSFLEVGCLKEIEDDLHVVCGAIQYMNAAVLDITLHHTRVYSPRFIA